MKLTPVLGGILTACLLSYAAHAKDLSDKTLSYVGSWSSLLNYKDFEEPFWKKQIPEASGGKWTIDISTFDQMGLNGSEVFRMLSKGAFSIGTTDISYVLSSAPELGGANLPMLITSEKMAKDVMDIYRPVLDNILSDRFSGAKLLGTSHFPQQALFCKDKITGMADLKGKKIRATGRSVAQFLNAIGAEGVTISFAEVPGALQRGVIDCAFTGTLSGYQAGWYEVASYLYPLPVAGWDFILTAMNGKEWKKLSPDNQAWLLDEVQKRYEDVAWAGAAAAYEEGVSCLTGGDCSHGTAASMKLVKVTDEDLDAARKIAIDKVIPMWVDLVDGATVKHWNETIGKVTGVSLAPK
jgi:TRAP-type C4-dicarboxylate transport system substrate-binding protein